MKLILGIGAFSNEGPESLGGSIGMAVFTLLMSIGLITYGCVAFFRFQRIRKSDNWIKTNATLDEITETYTAGGDDMGPEYQGIYTYHSIVDGETYYYKASNVYKSSERVPKTLELYYSKKHPDETCRKNVLFQVAAVIVGLVFAMFFVTSVIWIANNWL